MTTTKPETAEEFLARFREFLPTVTLLNYVSRRTDLKQALAHIETLMAERILNLKAIHEFQTQCEQANETIAQLQKRVDQGILNLQEANREIERLRAEREEMLEEIHYLIHYHWGARPALFDRAKLRLKAREGA